MTVMPEISEKQVEARLTKGMKEQGGKAYKWVSPGNVGVPDRICIFKDGTIAFVELKAPGKKPTALQENRHRELKKLGCKVCVLASYNEVDNFLELKGIR